MHRTMIGGDGCPYTVEVRQDPDVAAERHREEVEFENRPRPQTKDDSHVCTPGTCPEPSSYYVSAVDGPQWWTMAGPYSTHAEALADVDRARNITCDKDSSGRGHFMGWGTVRMANDYNQPGNLNKHGLI